MTLQPLLAAPSAIILHAFAAMSLIPLTALIFTIKRGSLWHKRLGWAWVLIMATVALSSFWVQEIRLFGPFSPIHALSLFTLGSLTYAIWRIRSGDRRAHRRAMLLLVWGALAGAGAFTLLPGRIMHMVVFGTA